ncbi:hypothetical protein FIBSPDRAFT_894544 [Athelia psychrophila]|uniref:Uncharacterized protein n=1 Tax=Athelia psychrophila TaxID=1759441 RepID=A0A166FTP3_9AGAM|nr:hypothetical protein FIBSPDRAFT_894544 [Fibularhizoctonia sp. CBS 109695]
MAKRWLHWLGVLRSQCGTIVTRMRDCTSLVAAESTCLREQRAYEHLLAFGGLGAKHISVIDVQVPGGGQDALEKKPGDLGGYDKIILEDRLLQWIGTDQVSNFHRLSNSDRP